MLFPSAATFPGLSTFPGDSSGSIPGLALTAGQRRRRRGLAITI